MASLCQNCGGPLIYDPIKEKLFCKMCGTHFDVRDVDVKDRTEYEEQYMDCNIYVCDHCGGEIIVNDTEVSTYCIYCGNPAVVFSRVAKQRRPEFILPFSVSQEQAVKILQMRIKAGFFVPYKIKHFKPESVRGIYIPYWIVNAEHYNASFLSGTVTNDNDNTETMYFERTGKATFKNLLLDASKALNDYTSEKLEPFDLTALQPFNEHYLAGFYSDMNDLTEQEIINAANRRSDDMFRQAVVSEVHARNVRLIDSYPYTEINDDRVYVMLPCWFITMQYNGEPLTVLINGDTGKAVGTFPFDKKRFLSLTILTAAVLSVALSYALYHVICYLIYSMNSDLASDILQFLVYAFAGISAAVAGVINRFKRFRSTLQLTKSSQTLHYVRRRQG